MSLLGRVGHLIAAPGALFQFLSEARHFEPAMVSGNSMKPTLRPGDRIAVRPLRANEPKEGQVVLVKLGARELVKRVASLDASTVTLQGDNRRASSDPGRVPREAISGVVVLRYWPLLG